MEQIQKIIRESIEVKKILLEDTTIQTCIKNVVDAITNCFATKHRLYLCGNGGSAADAQHIAAEFSGRFYKDRKALPAEAMHTNTSYITAIGNDYSFDTIYSRYVDGIMEQGDILIAISTSGNSKNIIEAAKKAKEKGIIVIGFTGATGGTLKEYCTYLLNVPSTITPRIQESHIMLGHIICELVEKNIFDA